MIQSQNLSLQIDNYKLRASNDALVVNATKCRMTADLSSGSAAITVDNNTGFTGSQLVLLGNFGDQIAEIQTVLSVTGKNTITLTGTTSFAHQRDTFIYVLEFDQVEFSNAPTLTGVKTILGGVAVSISPKTKTTDYQDNVNTTGYAFFRFKNSVGVTYSNYSTGVIYAGNPNNSVIEISKKAARKCGLTVGTSDFTKEDDLINDVDEAVFYITQATDWTFEKTTGVIPTITNETDYDISSLNVKHPGVKKSIFDVYFSQNKLLNYTSYQELKSWFFGKTKTYLTNNQNTGDTSIVVSDTTDLLSNGSITIEDLTISYTTVDDLTNTLSGIPSTGLGSITHALTANDVVLQNFQTGEPGYWTINNNSLILNKPVDIAISGKKLTIDFLKTIPDVVSMQDLVTIPFYRDIYDYVAYKIETRRKATEKAAQYLNDFNTKVQLAMQTYQVPTVQDYNTWTFQNEVYPKNLYPEYDNQFQTF